MAQKSAVKIKKDYAIIVVMRTSRGRSNEAAMDPELEVRRHEAWEGLFEQHVKGVGELWEHGGSDRKILEYRAW